MKAVLPAILVALTLSVPAMAADPIRVGDLVIEQAWARATVPSAKAGAVYLTVRNAGAQPERIASITTPVADHAMAHETRQEGDVLRMREPGPLTVPPGGPLEMNPGGPHIMLMDPKSRPQGGEEVPLPTPL